MAPEIKLTYFDLRGRAEPIRLAFIIGKIDFIDDRFSFPQFKEMREKTPFKSVPVMTVDGEEMTQSLAMLRYAGKLSGLYPTDPMDAFRVDEAIDVMTDLSVGIFKYRGPDKDQLREQREKFSNEDVPRYFGGFDKKLAAVNDGPFVLGDNLSIADIMVTTSVNAIKCGVVDYVDPNVFDTYPRLMKVYNAVMELPEVVEWYKKYPIPNVTE